MEGNGDRRGGKGSRGGLRARPGGEGKGGGGGWIRAGKREIECQEKERDRKSVSKKSPVAGCVLDM